MNILEHALRLQQGKGGNFPFWENLDKNNHPRNQDKLSIFLNNYVEEIKRKKEKGNKQN